MTTHAPLAVDDRATALQPDRDRRDHQQRRRSQQQQQGGQRDVQASIHVALPSAPLRMRILYLHQFFITREGVGGTRSYEFARRFVARGHTVRMAPRGGRRTVAGIDVVGARGGYADYVGATAMGYLQRMSAFARFALAATAQALRGPPPTSSTPPPRAADDGRPRARPTAPPRPLAPRCDLWPEAPICDGRAATTHVAAAGARASSASSTAVARVIALSPAIADAVAATGAAPARVRVVTNASDLEPVLAARPRRRSAGVSGSATASSASCTMGEANDLAQVEAAALVDGATFVLLGQRPRAGPRSSPEDARRDQRRLPRSAAGQGVWRGSPRPRTPASRSSRTCPCWPPARPTSSSTRCRGAPGEIVARPAGSVNWSSDTGRGVRPARGRRGPRREGRLAASTIPTPGRSATGATRAGSPSASSTPRAAEGALAVLQEAAVVIEPPTRRGQHERPRPPAGVPRRDRQHPSRRGGARGAGARQRLDRRVRGGGARPPSRRPADRAERRRGKAENDCALLREARGRYCLLLNEDLSRAAGARAPCSTRSTPTGLPRPAQLLTSDGRPKACAWRPGRRLGARRGHLRPGPLRDPEPRFRDAEVGWAQSSALLVRRCAAEAVGWLDPGFFVYSDETDFCKRLRDAGWRVLFVPAARVHHDQLNRHRRHGGAGSWSSIAAVTVTCESTDGARPGRSGPSAGPGPPRAPGPRSCCPAATRGVTSSMRGSSFVPLRARVFARRPTRSTAGEGGGGHLSARPAARAPSTLFAPMEHADTAQLAW